MTAHPLACLALLLFLAYPVQSRLLFTFVPPNEETVDFGSSTASVGDVNGDDCPDVAISGSAHTYVGGMPEYAGSIHVFSGKSGYLMYTLQSPNEDDDGAFGCSVAGAGDVNQDGYDDVIVGAMWEGYYADPPYLGRAYVFSGVDGSLLHTLAPPGTETSGYFGCSVAGLGDVDNDGYPDVVVGAFHGRSESSPMWAGRAYIAGGADGLIIHTLMSPKEEESGEFGYSVEGVGDVNSDRYPDVLVGAPGEGLSGRAYLFSGTDGSVLTTFASLSEESGYSFGTSLAEVGDVNSDGCPDVVIGAYRDHSDSSPDHAGRAYVYDGREGSLLHDLISPSEEENGYFGCSVAGIGDLNNDGYTDLVIGASGESGGTSSLGKGRAHVFSGLDGSVLRTFVSPEGESGVEFGQTVARAGDMNGDGYDDLLIAARENVYAFSGVLSPVDLVFFETEATDQEVVVRWRTEREYDCYGFQVFRQNDEEAERITVTDATIPGGCDWTEPRDYQYVDEVPEAGEYQYWLEMTATDGRRVEYGPIDVGVYPFLVLRGPYPNPVVDETLLELLIPEDTFGDVVLTLHDMAGRELAEPAVQAGRYVREVSWNATAFGVSAGVYRWRLRAGGKEAFRTMVVVP